MDVMKAKRMIKAVMGDASLKKPHIKPTAAKKNNVAHRKMILRMYSFFDFVELVRWLYFIL